MILRLGCDIQFEIPTPVTMVALLSVHPSRLADLRVPDEVQAAPALPMESCMDSFGNRCSRFVAPKGALRLTNSTLIYDSGVGDLVSPAAREVPIQELQPEILRYLLQQPALRSGQIFDHCIAVVWRSDSRMVTRASNLRLDTLKS